MTLAQESIKTLLERSLTYRPRRGPPQEGVGQGRDVGLIER